MRKHIMKQHGSNARKQDSIIEYDIGNSACDDRHNM